MTSTDLVPAPYRIPDGIEPVEGWRCWNWDGTHLVSLNLGVPWPAGERMEATCQQNGHAFAVTATYMPFAAPTRYRWGVERGKGMTRAGACNWLANANGGSNVIFPSPPRIDLPDGYGYILEVEPPPPPPKHETPVEQCSCGVYAVTDIDRAPDGPVYGKVKMWGKVIEGDRGFRAEFAYPCELWAPASLLSDKGLLAYGVPLHDAADKDAPRKPVAAPQVATLRVTPGQWMNVQSTTANSAIQFLTSALPPKRRPLLWPILLGAAAGNLAVQVANVMGWL